MYKPVTYDAICAIIRGRNLIWRFTNQNGDWNWESVNENQLDGYLLLTPVENDQAVRPIDEVEVWKITFRDDWFYYESLV